MFESLRGKNIEPLIVQQCKFLEHAYGTNITDTILDDVAECPLSLRSVKKTLQEKDRDLIWETSVQS